MNSNHNQRCKPSNRSEEETGKTTTSMIATPPKLERVSSKISNFSSPSNQTQTQKEGRKSSLEISPEDQLRIIQQTGILQDEELSVPLQRFSQSKFYHDQKNSKLDKNSKTKPLIEFTTHELNSFKKIKTNRSNDQTLEKSDDKDEDGLEETSELNDANQSVDTLPLWVDRAFDIFLWAVPFNTFFICLDVAIHAQYGQPVTFWGELNRLKNVFPSSIFLIYYTLHYHETILSKLLLFSLSTIGGSYMVYIMNKLSYLLVMKKVPPLGSLWIYSVIRMDLSHAVLSLFLVFIWSWIMNLSIYV